MQTREAWIALANAAAADPSGAQDAARQLATAIEEALARGEGDSVPWGYLYAGAKKLVARVEDLAAEPLPTQADPNRPALTESGNPFQVNWTIPYNLFAFASSARAVPDYNSGFAGAIDTLAWSFSGAAEGRDLFSVQMVTEGTVHYQVTGVVPTDVMMPASVLHGTGQLPRIYAWRIPRGTKISWKFRNITNFYLPDGNATDPPNLAVAEVVLACLALDH